MRFRSLENGGALLNALVFTHFEIAANLWTLFVNPALHGISIQRRAPAIFQSRHGHTAPLVGLDKMSGYTGITDQ